jgi:YggT family protein
MLLGLVFLSLRVAQLLVIGAVITSWLNMDPSNRVVRFLRETTEPLFKLVRPIAEKIPVPVDLSPMIVLLGIEVARRVLELLP